MNNCMRNMLRFRPESTDSKRILVYPLSQWGDAYADYCGPEDAKFAIAREMRRRQAKPSAAHERPWQNWSN